MALFLGVHKIPEELSETEIAQGFEKYKGNAQAKGIKAVSAVYSKEKGFAYCQTEASSAQEVWDAHKDLQIPLEDVVEIKSLH